MNAVVREQLPVIDINSALSLERLTSQFQSDKRLHITNFLPYASADALSRYLLESMAYQTYVVANRSSLGTPPGDGSVLTSEEEREMLEFACDGARNGFASYFESDRSLEEPEASGTPAVAGIYADCVAFLNSPRFLEFVSTITGITNLKRAEVRATRFRAGHFQLFSNGTWSADTTGKRRLNFELNLTHQWRPEWGGLLEMRGHEGHQIEGVMPCFNSLELFAFPRGYWISQVAPFAAAARYGISGSLYVE